MTDRVAVVTGSNKGIGFATIKVLSKKFPGLIYLTARDENRGKAALDELVKYMVEKHNGIDILVNNAGMAFSHDAKEPIGVQAEVTLKTNYFALREFSRHALPIMKKHGRVVNVSSMLAKGQAMKNKLADPNITYEQLDSLANDFVSRAQNGTHIDGGWINSSYSVSKMLVSVLTRIQQRECDKERPNDDIVINAIHPGYVDTDMTKHKGVFDPERGSQASVFCALLPNNEKKYRGAYVWHDGSLVDLTADSFPSS